MAKLSGQVTDVFRSPADVEATRTHFMNLQAIADATDALDRSELLGGGKLRMVLQEQNHGVYKVSPSYVVHYRAEGDDVVWSTVEGNMVSEGRARFTARGDGGTDVHYSHRIELDMPVGALVAKMLQPIVSRMVEPNIRDFVAKLLAGLRA